jgi:Leucine-rich repeat (LRR) protein
MKTIELADEECWWIDVAENTEKVKYVISEKVYSKLGMIILYSSCSVDFQIFEGIELNAPNLELISIEEQSQSNIPVFEGIKFNTPKLKMISLNGIGSVKCFQNIQENNHFLLPEELSLFYTGIHEIPDFILKAKTLTSLSFRGEKMTELPNALFTLENLQRLGFHYCTGIKIIPDDIKNLINLEHFDLWAANVQYLSPELFLLPKLKSLNFAYTQYSPTKEVLDAYEIFKGKKKDYHHTMPWVKS